MTDHLVLVPGFGGFDALGTLRYYHGVTEALRDAPVVLHYFPNLPTASVRTRARQLRVWLAELDRRRILARGDAVHLVGHSTGGLDLRQLLRDAARLLGTAGDTAGLEVLGRVRSVQFLSTPHRGTALAHHLNASPLRAWLARGVARGAYECTRTLREGGAATLARALRRVLPARPTPDWVDALLDTAAGFHGGADDLERAHARASYFEALRWLLHVASDFSAIADLDPVRRPLRESPEGARALAQEQAFLAAQGIRCASVVTVAPPPGEGEGLTLYGVLHRLTALHPPRQLGGPVTVRRMLLPGPPRTLRPGDNDGLVNSVSMVWPDPDRSFLVEADHADVIGHFASAPPPPDRAPHPRDRQYDLLQARAGFHQLAFEALWRQVAAFALGEPYPAARAPAAA